MSKKIVKGFKIEIGLCDGGSVTHEFPEGASIAGILDHIIKYIPQSCNDLNALLEAVQDAIDKNKD